jgi:peptide/nickel transport system ATP-binding protein
MTRIHDPGGDPAGLLTVKDLTVDFTGNRGTRLRAVDHVSFALAAGSTVALVGESGSGKSTVVRAIARLQRRTTGSITLGGSRAHWLGSGLREYRRRVQIVFQDPYSSLNPSHTVGHHLRRPLLIHGKANQRTVESAVEELLTSVSLVPAAELVRKYPHELSGGQRQRVAIARALAPAPEVLLADEPVSMLDVSVRLEILNLIDQQKRERDLAVLYVTHDLATARYFSSDIMVMYRGEIVERGSADEVILNPAHPYTRMLASAAPDPSQNRSARAGDRQCRRAREAGARPGPTAEAVGCRYAGRCPFVMDVCRSERPPDLEITPGHLARCWLYRTTDTPAALTTQGSA